MSRKVNVNLPQHQTVHFSNRVLWELIRITAQMNELPISELVECAVENFFKSDNKDQIIAKLKLARELKNEQR